jgi:opacity protein-like surface antigen
MKASIAVLVAAAGVVASAAAQVPEVRRSNERTYDISVGVATMDAESTGFDGGTRVDTRSSTGFAFTFDYHFSERWSAGVTASAQQLDYVADIAIAGPLGLPGQRVSGELDTSSLIGHAKRYFGDFPRVAPYASVGLGFVSIDTNIPSGPPFGVCWWHPWWGYVCDSVQPTRSSTEPAAVLGAGVRVGLTDRLFLDLGVARQWIDFDTAHRPGFSELRLALGIR